MAKKQRSLKTQLNYAVSESKKTGQSKHADKHNPNIDTKNFIYAMERGGWAADNILKSVYQQTFSSERKKVDAIIDGYFNGIINGTENAETA